MGVGRVGERPTVAAPSGGGSGGAVVYARGPVSGLPEEHASRRERFAELDTLQVGGRGGRAWLGCGGVPGARCGVHRCVRDPGW